MASTRQPKQCCRHEGPPASYLPSKAIRSPPGDHDAWLNSRSSPPATPLPSTWLFVNRRTLPPLPSITYRSGSTDPSALRKTIRPSRATAGFRSAAPGSCRRLVCRPARSIATTSMLYCALAARPRAAEATSASATTRASRRYTRLPDDRAAAAAAVVIGEMYASSLQGQLVVRREPDASAVGVDE